MKPSTVTWVIRPMFRSIKFNQFSIMQCFEGSKLSFKNSISLPMLHSNPKVYFTGTIQLTGGVYEIDDVMNIVSYIYECILDGEDKVFPYDVLVTSIMANYSIKATGPHEAVGNLYDVRKIMDDCELTHVCAFSKPHQLIALFKRPATRLSQVVRVYGSLHYELMHKVFYQPNGKSDKKCVTGKLTMYSNGSMNVCSPSLDCLSDMIQDAIALRDILVSNRKEEHNKSPLTLQMAQVNSLA